MADKTEAALYDSLQHHDGIWLHGGMGKDMYVEAEAAESARRKAFGLAESGLAFMSFSQMSPCYPAKLLLTYDATPGLQNRPFEYQHAVHDVPPTLASLRKVETDLFFAVSSQYEFVTVRLGRAIQWMRKGLMEHHTLDEFASYWVALEIVAAELKKVVGTAGEESYLYCPKCSKPLTPCPACGCDTGKESDWAGSSNC